MGLKGGEYMARKVWRWWVLIIWVGAYAARCPS